MINFDQNRKKLGKIGEQMAREFFLKKKFPILAENYHSPYGEIDLIVFNQKENELLLIEVKTRKSNKFGLPEDAITRSKLLKIIKTGYSFQEKNPKYQNLDMRIDAIVIEFSQDLKILRFEHLKRLSLD